MKKIYVKPYIIPIMLVNSSQKHQSQKHQMQKHYIETSLNYMVYKYRQKFRQKKNLLNFDCLIIVL